MHQPDTRSDVRKTLDEQLAAAPLLPIPQPAAGDVVRPIEDCLPTSPELRGMAREIVRVQRDAHLDEQESERLRTQRDRIAEELPELKQWARTQIAAAKQPRR